MKTQFKPRFGRIAVMVSLLIVVLIGVNKYNAALLGPAIALLLFVAAIATLIAFVIMAHRQDVEDTEWYMARTDKLERRIKSAKLHDTKHQG